MNDPSNMDLPIAHNPTFLNMDLAFEDIHFKDVLIKESFNSIPWIIFFGENLDVKFIESIKIDFLVENLWIWASSTQKASILASVYDHLNSNSNPAETWKGWAYIWNLCVLPHI